MGGAELHKRKQQIQSYSDQTSSALKKHVYANYMQFIETAKEISRKLENLRSFFYRRVKCNTILIFSPELCRLGIRNVPAISFTH